MKFLITTLLFLSFNTNAKEVNKVFQFPNFNGAKSAKSFIRFDMKSTKAGMFTSTIPGFVKLFKISSDVKEKKIGNVTISFKTAKMDTDDEDRDEKMHNFCLDSKKFPHIELNFPEMIEIGGSGQLQGFIKIKGNMKPITISANSMDKGSEVRVFGKSSVKLSYLEIPDPSIWIAKLDDEIEINFDVLIPKN